jgi:hypothetical protein
MVIESRNVVGAAAALAIVGAALWGSASLMAPSTADKHSQVEIKQLDERAWSVEVKDVAFQPAQSQTQKTAAVTR